MHARRRLTLTMNSTHKSRTVAVDSVFATLRVMRDTIRAS